MSRYALVTIVFLLCRTALASDACSTTAITATAEVDVSDGSSFQIESLYHTRDHSSIRHLYPDDKVQLVVVEGPFAWFRVNDEAQPGFDFHQIFALGHQYHAFLLHFDEILDGVTEDSVAEYNGESRAAKSGNYPFGGNVFLVAGDTRPEALVFEFGEIGHIEVALSDWRQVGDVELPFHARIDDGERVFEYRYTAVAIEERSPLWFYEALPAPAIDEVQVHRLHRKLLAAHCLGDADMMADLSAPFIVTANRGSLDSTAREAVRERFGALFSSLDYRSYVDIERPVIEVSSQGDVGWIGVNVQASGVQPSTGQTFDDQWAWIMTVHKIDGAWLHAGNASNRLE